jgi:hypothetical protein
MKDNLRLSSISARCKRARKRPSGVLIAIRQLYGFLVFSDGFRQLAGAFIADAEIQMFRFCS